MHEIWKKWEIFPQNFLPCPKILLFGDLFSIMTLPVMRSPPKYFWAGSHPSISIETPIQSTCEFSPLQMRCLTNRLYNRYPGVSVSISVSEVKIKFTPTCPCPRIAWLTNTWEFYGCSAIQSINCIFIDFFLSRFSTLRK